MGIVAVDIRQKQAASQTILDMQILDGKSGLALVLDYAASRYEKESMEKYQSIFIKIAQKLVKNVSQEDVTVKQIRDMFVEKKPSFFARLFKKNK